MIVRKRAGTKPEILISLEDVVDSKYYWQASLSTVYINLNFSDTISWSNYSISAFKRVFRYVK